MKKIKISSGYECILDDDDYDKFSKFNWFASKKRSGIYVYRSQRYGIRKENKRLTIYLHREIMNAKKYDYVDHINGNTLDNRKQNLRICTNEQNLHNSKKTNKECTSKFKGVCWDKSKKKWLVSITINKKHKFIGRYDSELEAAEIYNKHATLIYGEFAKLNKLDSGDI